MTTGMAYTYSTLLVCFRVARVEKVMFIRARQWWLRRVAIATAAFALVALLAGAGAPPSTAQAYDPGYSYPPASAPPQGYPGYAYPTAYPTYPSYPYYPYYPNWGWGWPVGISVGWGWGGWWGGHGCWNCGFHGGFAHAGFHGGGFHGGGFRGGGFSGGGFHGGGGGFHGGGGGFGGHR